MLEVLPDILRRSAERHPDREAVRDPQGTRTYGGLFAESRAIACALVAAGLTPRGRCLILIPNSLDFLRAHFAVLEGGGISVPGEANLSASSLLAICESCAPEFILTDDRTYSRLRESLRGLAAKVVIFGTREPEERVPHHFGVDGFLSDFRGDRVHTKDPLDVAVLMYTTGATGQAKGVSLTHRNVLAAISNIIDFVGYRETDREVVTIPLSHNFGMGHAYCNLVAGGAVYVEPGLTRVGRALGALQTFGATGFPGTPLGFGMLIERYGPVLAEKGKNLRFIVVNSAPLPPERTDQLRELLPNTEIFVYYGLTEASRSTFLSLTGSGPSLRRSVGRPMSGIELRVVDAQGEPVPAGVEGQVVIQGPTVTPGYWNSPEETADALRGGWLQTGDLGRLDPEGHLFLTGRLKDVVNVGGYKVNPSEVESVLGRFPGISDVAVAGVTGAGLEEMLVAGFVSADPGVGLDEVALQEYCSRHLERYKHPSRYVSLTQIPRSDTGKVKRHELAVQLAELISVTREGSSC